MILRTQAREAMAKEMKKRNLAAGLLGLVYRFYLRRQLARAARTRDKARDYLYHRVASIVESAARGRLGRRRARTIANLQYIQTRHPLSLHKALHQRFETDDRGREMNEKRLKKVFWYKKKIELDCLYKDYFTLCERKGFNPCRLIMEQNIEEIARRIRVREAYLITLIQAIYRGLILRKCLKIYRYEVIRIREIRAQSCFMIGKVYRGYVARKLRVPARLAQVLRRRRPEQYARERRKTRDRVRAKAARTRLLALYERERAEESTARATGLVNPSSAGGKKMAAFLDSAYGDDRTRRGGRQILDGVAEYDRRIAQEKASAQARKDWLQEHTKDAATEGPAKWLRGTVAKDHFDGTYAIDFDDGTREAHVDCLKLQGVRDHPPPSLGHKWKVGMVCLAKFSHRRDLCGRDGDTGTNRRRYYHRDEMSANSSAVIECLTTFQAKVAHDPRKLLRAHNSRMQRRNRGISFDYPERLYVDPRAALYEGTNSPVEETRVVEHT